MQRSSEMSNPPKRLQGARHRRHRTSVLVPWRPDSRDQKDKGYVIYKWIYRYHPLYTYLTEGIYIYIWINKVQPLKLKMEPIMERDFMMISFRNLMDFRALDKQIPSSKRFFWVVCRQPDMLDVLDLNELEAPLSSHAQRGCML